MCKIFSGHININKTSKNWGKIIYLSGIHHEKDREQIKEKVAAWETNKYCSFSEGFKIAHTEGDITPTERKQLLSLLDDWGKAQNAEELFLKLVSITQNGKPLARDKFTLDLENKTIATEEDNVVFDFTEVSNFTITAGDYNTITAGDDNTITASHYNTITAGYRNTITASDDNTITAGDDNTITAGYRNTITASHDNTITAGDDNTITAGYRNTITASHYNTITASHDNTITADINCVYIRKDIFEFFEIPANVKIKLNGYQLKGYEKV